MYHHGPGDTSSRRSCACGARPMMAKPRSKAMTIARRTQIVSPKSRTPAQKRAMAASPPRLTEYSGKQPRRELCSTLGLCQHLEALGRLARPELRRLLVPGASPLPVWQDAEHAHLAEHRRIIGRAECERRAGIARLRGTRQQESTARDVTLRDQIL